MSYSPKSPKNLVNHSRRKFCRLATIFLPSLGIASQVPASLAATAIGLPTEKFYADTNERGYIIGREGEHPFMEFYQEESLGGLVLNAKHQEKGSGSLVHILPGVNLSSSPNLEQKGNLMVLTANFENGSYICLPFSYSHAHGVSDIRTVQGFMKIAQEGTIFDVTSQPCQDSTEHQVYLTDPNLTTYFWKLCPNKEIDWPDNFMHLVATTTAKGVQEKNKPSVAMGALTLENIYPFVFQGYIDESGTAHSETGIEQNGLFNLENGSLFIPATYMSALNNLTTQKIGEKNDKEVKRQGMWERRRNKEPISRNQLRG